MRLFPVVILALSLYPLTAVGSRPVLWYPLERSGTQTDIGTAPQANGTLTGSAVILSGTSPNSYSCASLDLTALPPGNNYLTSTVDVQKLDALPELTVTLWVNLRAAPADGDCLVSDMPSGFPPAGQGGWELRIVNALGGEPISTGLFSLSFEALKAMGSSNIILAGTSTTTGASNQWMFFAATYDSARVQRFYQGKTTAAVAQFGFNTIFDPDDYLRDNSAALRIGGASSEPTTDRTPPGWIDDVRIYNNALTVAQLDQIRLENMSTVNFNTVPSFFWLGDLPGRGCYNVAGGMSRDGTIVVGQSLSDVGFEPYRWINGAYTPLGLLPGNGLSGQGLAVSEDGSVVVGLASTPDTSYQGFRWVNGALSPLPDLPGGEIVSVPAGITADGTTVVGYSADGTGYEEKAVQWVNGALQQIPIPDSTESFANDISADGSVIVGSRVLASGDSEVFRLDDGQLTTLPDLPGGPVVAAAQKLSADKKVIIGRSTTGINFEIEGALWRNGLVINMGDLPGGFVYGLPQGVTRHGTLVVGAGFVAGNTSEATIWDRHHGLRRLADALPADYGLDVTYWYLQSAVGISDDGSVIVGYGNAPSGVVASWMVRLPALPAIADFDHDQDVDQDDIDLFAACATGSHVPYNPVALPSGCTMPPDLYGFIEPDLDWDGDVDPDDFAEVQRCYSGENQPPPPDCRG
ncbi:MAG: hypothetical protein HY718_19475 [Planctomycetes bacterium]|nr:hypothetical protein [Planctomycetota bacterium]